MTQIKRSLNNPLIRPEDITPSSPGFKVDGVFNCGVCRFQDEIILACRVAESVQSDDPDKIIVPLVEEDGGTSAITTVTVSKQEHPDWNFSDSRTISTRNADGQKQIKLLTSLSHIRMARSKDGEHFVVDDAPAIPLVAGTDSWGMEDPRITEIDGTYYINYTSVTPSGPATSLVATTDFVSYNRLGVIFAPENKDVTIFPEKIGGKYYALNRPSSSDFDSYNMWLAESPDLVHWGNQRLFAVAESEWENGRVGGGAPPLRTPEGWLVIYHAADAQNRYCLGAMLLDLEHPEIVLKRTQKPFMVPEADYETDGFFGNVVFTCGALLEDETLIIYYGASDESICRADIPLTEIYKALDN